jgi:cytochrome b6-f complex iron-sulfur subunit
MARNDTSDPEPGSQRKSVPRRDFLAFVGVGSITTATVGSGILSVDYASPNVLFEPSLFFAAGNPDEYEDGVDERWKRKQKTWIIRENGTIYALVAVCTHLGCVPNWDADSRLFRCPCHGSTFTPEGDVVTGPAPEPLYRAPIQLDDDGNLIVGTGQMGFGRPDQTNRPAERDGPGFRLRVQA